MRASLSLALLLALPLGAQRPKPTPATSAAPAAYDSAAFRALQWRNIGPFRGGRAVAITGVTAQPLTYYAGYTGGGVWKTEDAGISWRNISDGFFRTSSIGAITVAESDPNVIYVGTGEHAVRGQSSSFGDGVYKSTDAGKTWTKIGLEKTKQISNIRVHPRNADLVYVAAQGDRWTGTPDRGIYRSTDGGRNWTLVLKGENATSGASALSMDPTNPRVLYAAFWDHQRQPWMVRSGGPGSGIWKSTDGGDSWTRLTQGLPKLMGKIGVDVSPANPDRVFAIVEAEKGGLYRSDDAGKTWRLMSEDRLIQTRSWYYMNITADPKNADVVWVMNAPIMRSIDGGATFATVPARHGDNHQLWINPSDAHYVANANDGGDRFAGWRQELEHAGQPADGAVLPHCRGRRLSVPALCRPAGQHVGRHQEPHRRRVHRRRRLVFRPGVRERQRGRGPREPAPRLRRLLPGDHRGTRHPKRPHAAGHAVSRPQPHGAVGPDEVPLQLDGTHRGVAARRPRGLPRRQRAVQDE
ncbi:MAG: WD40/YVTN/BNR-like repeat-containing protein [Gemmatimonadaceae bacterium]